MPPTIIGATNLLPCTNLSPPSSLLSYKVHWNLTDSGWSWGFGGCFDLATAGFAVDFLIRVCVRGFSFWIFDLGLWVFLAF